MPTREMIEIYPKQFPNQAAETHAAHFMQHGQIVGRQAVAADISNRLAAQPVR
jgi:hypothetical protein